MPLRGLLRLAQQAAIDPFRSGPNLICRAGGCASQNARLAPAVIEIPDHSVGDRAVGDEAAGVLARTFEQSGMAVLRKRVRDILKSPGVADAER
jgi:hypothetical protein